MLGLKLIDVDKMDFREKSAHDGNIVNKSEFKKLLLRHMDGQGPFSIII